MIDIQSPTFIDDFDMTKATVGQVGYGFIGNSVVELFRKLCPVIVYDKAGYEGRECPQNVTMSPDLDGVVASAEVIFVAVPTPMKPSGECHTAILESVLQDIQNTAAKIGRDMGEFMVVHKCTVPPGFTARMQERFALRLLFSPEFLTEASAVQDFKRTNRVLLGGEHDDAQVVFKFFEAVWPDRQLNTYMDHPDGPVQIIQCDPTVAEMVKLSTNVHLMSKVVVSNELYLMCQALGIEYDHVKILTQFDRRIGMSHMNVPGADGKLASSGSCFPKDVNNLRWVSKTLGTGERMFTTIHERNLEIRGEADWEHLKGRAIVDE